MTHIGEVGHRGERARSDCWVRVEARADGGVNLCVKSKVEAMYGDAVRRTCREVLDALEVRNAAVTVEDQGAVDFVLAARIGTSSGKSNRFAAAGPSLLDEAARSSPP